MAREGKRSGANGDGRKLDDVGRLRRLNILQQAAIDASLAGIVVVNAEERIEICNAAALQILGGSEGSPTNLSESRAMRLDGTPYLFEELPIVRTLREGEPVACEDVIYQVADQYRWTEQHTVPVRDRGGIVAAVAVIVDVTDRKVAAREAQPFRAMAEVSPDFVAMADPAGETLYLNPGGRGLCGMSRGVDVRGIPLSSFYPVDQSKRLVEEAIPTALRDGLWQGETELLGRDAEIVPVSQVLMAHYDKSGRPAYLSTVMRDLRETRRLEAQLLHRQKLEAVGRLAGGVARDFNNMLLVITNYVSMGIEALPESDPLRPDLTMALDAANRSVTLCRQLLGFARKQFISPRVVCVNDLLRHFERFIRHIVGEDIEFRMCLAPKLGRVRIDPSQFDQIVSNLVVNARDAQPDGGRLVIETSNAELDESYALLPEVKPGKYVMIAVSDCGHGMTRDVVEHAFEPFFTTKDVGQGTGLGLASVHGAVKQNGGHIGIYSEVGRGTTVRVYLPRVDGDALDAQLPPSKELRPTETVLVVEDERMVLDLTVRMLESAGFRVLQSNSPAEAIEIATRHDGPIHVLLTDVVMPKMNGPKLAKTLRATRPEMRVLFVSGYTDETICHQGVVGNDVEFLPKPFGRKELVQRLCSVLERGAPLDAEPRSSDRST